MKHLQKLKHENKSMKCLTLIHEIESLKSGKMIAKYIAVKFSKTRKRHQKEKCEFRKSMGHQPPLLILMIIRHVL